MLCTAHVAMACPGCFDGVVARLMNCENGGNCDVASDRRKMYYQNINSLRIDATINKQTQMQTRLNANTTEYKQYLFSA